MIADFSQETREAFLGCKLLVARWKKCNSLGKNAPFFLSRLCKIVMKLVFVCRRSAIPKLIRMRN